MLAYGATGPTKDIDTWNNIPPAVLDAYRRVVGEGEDVPVEKAGVADLPCEAEDRFVQVDIGLEHLEEGAAVAASLMVPAPHTRKP